MILTFFPDSAGGTLNLSSFDQIKPFDQGEDFNKINLLKPETPQAAL